MFKRIFDFVVSFIALLLLLPVLLVIGLMVSLKLGNPVFFIQIRPGKAEEPFRMIKFRTMTNERDSEGNLLPNEKRMTKFGKFLRSASLDELPELLNVLKGDMSLVGPRPLLMDYLPYFTEEQSRRHGVRPGITGWAQVNGRNAIGWEKKLEFDTWYVENRSFLLDLKIIWLTLFKVIKKEGITHEGYEGMPRFDHYMEKNKTTS